jgi:hypothetical protein
VEKCVKWVKMGGNSGKISEKMGKNWEILDYMPKQS